MPKTAPTKSKKTERAEADRVSAAWARAADEVRAEWLKAGKDVGDPSDGATLADTGAGDLAFMDAVEARVEKILAGK